MNLNTQVKVKLGASAAILALCFAFGLTLNGCGAASGSAEEAASGSNSSDAAINVVSREDGSGTRGAFIELFEIEEKDDSGAKVDMTTEAAAITNSTAVMKTTVAGDVNAIGYLSLGSLDDTVKAVEIDGAAASAANVKSGEYKVSRPFNVVTTSSALSEAAQDFLSFILSDDGQAVVEEEGYIPMDGTGAYSAAGLSGTVKVAGSSSVTPVMEKLAEAYEALNPSVAVEINQSDSTTGVTSALEGACDLGMASRELKDSETSQGALATVIATDGIAVIVNNDNSCDGLTSEQVKAIFTGETTTWGEIG